jgi:cobalamin biosynthesis Mg chelatase CobN
LAALIYYVTFIYAAATVETLNGPLGQGATVTIIYKVVGTPTIKVTLKAVDQTTKTELPISDDLPAALTSLSWTVNVPPSTYVLAINDGSGVNFSGPFTVVAGTGPTSAPVTGTPPVTTPPATTPVSTPPATTPVSSPPATSSSKAPGSVPPTSSGTATSAAATTPATATPKSSAPTSFSGYSLLVSLTVVAAVMFHLA